MLEGPVSRREYDALPNCEWTIVESEETRAVPNLSWADIVRLEADDLAIQARSRRLEQERWTQVPVPAANQPIAIHVEQLAVDEHDHDQAQKISKKRAIDFRASQSKRGVPARARHGKNRISGGRYANRIFGRQYDLKDDREVRHEMKEMW